MIRPIHADDRARITFVDVIMSFGVLVTLTAISPWLLQIVSLLETEADPLTGVLLALFIPFLFIALILSMGVSAQQR